MRSSRTKFRRYRLTSLLYNGNLLEIVPTLGWTTLLHLFWNLLLTVVSFLYTS
jgi:hypothetical protein